MSNDNLRRQLEALPGARPPFKGNADLLSGGEQVGAIGRREQAPAVVSREAPRRKVSGWEVLDVGGLPGAVPEREKT